MIEKELLNTIRHIALATVNEDGSPHNTPLFFIYNDDFSKMYWGSHPESLHTKNIERTGQGHVVVYESEAYGAGGLYIYLENAHEVSKKELHEALNVHNKARARWGKDHLPIEYYQKLNGQRMYVADMTKIEAYKVDKDDQGHITKEGRIEISAQELLS